MIRQLLMTLRDPWASVEGWRARRERMVERRQEPTYEVYPDTDMPPSIRLYIEARDVRGRLIREYVELEGYSLHQLNWKHGAKRGGSTVRDWFVSRVMESMIRLAQRLDEERERKEQA